MQRKAFLFYDNRPCLCPQEKEVGTLTPDPETAGGWHACNHTIHHAVFLEDLFIFYFMCVHILSASVYVYPMYARCPGKSNEGALDTLKLESCGWLRDAMQVQVLNPNIFKQKNQFHNYLTGARFISEEHPGLARWMSHPKSVF